MIILALRQHNGPHEGQAHLFAQLGAKLNQAFGAVDFRHAGGNAVHFRV